MPGSVRLRGFRRRLFLLLCFQLIFKFLALLGLGLFALLALGVELLFSAKEFDEGLLSADFAFPPFR